MNCEQIRIAAMALVDGEVPLLSPTEIEAHVSHCAECGEEIAKLGMLAQLWQAQARQPQATDVWPAIEQRLEQRMSRPSRHWLPALVAILVALKAIEYVSNRRFGIWAQLIPLLLAAAVFAIAGLNPFQIKTELQSQEESL